MKRILLATAFVALTSPAFAGSCPKHMADIDAALPAAKLDAAKMTEVKKLRADGDAAHKAGNHAASMEALTKAKAILNLK
jgi:hypothetical protein